MSSLRDIVNNDDQLTDVIKYYWNYMYDLGKETVVPYIKEQGAFKKGYKIAEIGSAEGGVLAAFVEEGATEALGTDIALERLESGKRIAQIGNLDIEFTSHDIIYEEPKDEWKEKFDLVLLRDVIEHLDDATIALKNIKKILKPGGHLFVTFPPYYSPYGGHQHTVQSTGGKLPYIHLLPNSIFHKIIEKGRPNDIYEVKRLGEIRLTIPKFEKSIRDSGWNVAKRDYYFLRPVFKMKFGLPTLKMTPIARLPLIKTFFTLEASYLLKK